MPTNIDTAIYSCKYSWFVHKLLARFAGIYIYFQSNEKIDKLHHLQNFLL